MRNIPVSNDKKLLAGIGEDAIGYQWDDDIMVQSVDIITPVVDDPYQFGAIACANALSDLYAKGADPLFALNIVGFPASTLPLYYLEEILKGGADKLREAGAHIVGGHTIDDPSPKYGLSVTGTIPKDNFYIGKKGAAAGDLIVLTKPIGIGVYTTAIDQKQATETQQKAVVQEMLKLNRSASLAMRQVDTHACTDVTGFGLIGHLSDIAFHSEISFRIQVNKIPFLPDSLQLLKQGCVSEGLYNNLSSYKNNVQHLTDLSQEEEWLLYDPQTSGGLLIFVPENQAEKLLSLLAESGETGEIIGEVIEKNDYHITTNKRFL